MSQSADFQQRASAWQAAMTGDPKDAAAALAKLDEIDDPALLHLTAQALDNDARLGERRIADLAVEALTDRLHLPISFARRPGAIYGPDEIAEVKRLLRQAIPK